MFCFKFIKIKDLSFKNNKVSKEIKKVEKELFDLGLDFEEKK